MPIEKSNMISTIVTYIGNKLAKNEPINNFLNDFSEATVNWIRPLFIKDDGEESDIMQELKEAPTDEDVQIMVQSKLKRELKRKPEVEDSLKEIYEKIKQTEEGAKIINDISNSKNVVTGNIQAGGNVKTGDETNTSIGNSGINFQGISSGRDTNINQKPTDG